MRHLRLATALICCLSLAAFAGQAQAALPSIHHVFVIVLENESASTTFGPGSPAPYLSQTLRSQGAYLPKYYGIGHESNDNYIAMISGQAPNAATQSDCQTFSDFGSSALGPNGQALGPGCVYPTSVQTIGDQLISAGLTWRDYNQDMGADPQRESSVCGHPGVGMQDNTQKATATDSYATRHNPFVYFHSIIDDTTLCDTHVVGLDMLTKDLASATNTPNYVFITPDLCNDGHDAPCANGQPGGLAQADAFLRQWVPRITGSPAFKSQNGLLIVTFDEADTQDATACCGEIPGPDSPLPGIFGPGGGKVGAVLLSPCIAPGTVSQTPYNHYTMLRSVEDLYGLSHIGYAGLSGEQAFGSDVFTRNCPLAQANAPPSVRVSAPSIASSASTRPQIRVSWKSIGAGATGYAVQVQQGAGVWRTLLASTTRRSLTFTGRRGQTYQFRVRALSASGLTGAFATAMTVTPTGVHPKGAHYIGRWHVAKVKGAWQGHAIKSSKPNAKLALRYVGGALEIIGDRGPTGGRARVTFDGHSSTINLHAARARMRQVIYRRAAAAGTHRLTLKVLSGVVALEGLAISSRTG
ncbi:MAG: alkaline phosphatase family protein [Solirubrobacteraceae bacterium]